MCCVSSGDNLVLIALWGMSTCSTLYYNNTHTIGTHMNVNLNWIQIQVKLKYRNTKISTNTDHRKVLKIMCTLLCGECFTLTNIDSTVQLCNMVSYTNIITRIQICLHEHYLSQGLPNNKNTQNLKCTGWFF